MGRGARAEAGGETTSKPVGELVEELRGLVTDYVRQETVEPAKNLGRRFGFSVAGGVVLGGGFILALIGILRFLQTEVWVFPESAYWSWAPYLITGLVGIVIVAVSAGLAKGS